MLKELTDKVQQRCLGGINLVNITYYQGVKYVK